MSVIWTWMMIRNGWLVLVYCNWQFRNIQTYFWQKTQISKEDVLHLKLFLFGWIQKKTIIRWRKTDEPQSLKQNKASDVVLVLIIRVRLWCITLVSFQVLSECLVLYAINWRVEPECERAPRLCSEQSALILGTTLSNHLVSNHKSAPLFTVHSVSHPLIFFSFF